MKRGVQYATDNDMYVIIDWHVLNENSPLVYEDEAKKFFEEMAKPMPTRTMFSMKSAMSPAAAQAGAM